jgi:hypothetical protein
MLRSSASFVTLTVPFGPSRKRKGLMALGFTFRLELEDVPVAGLSVGTPCKQTCVM